MALHATTIAQVSDAVTRGVRVSTTTSREEPATTRAAPLPGAQPRSASPSPAAALELQRQVGNRATARVLTRWAAHPDKDKKGQFMTDENAAEWNRFNPPMSK